MKKSTICLTLATALLLASCGGPSKSELRVELQSIEGEMWQLEMMARDFQSQMSQAEWQSFIGGFAAGFGVVNGDGQMAISGGSSIMNASGNYDRAQNNLQQLQQRFNQLSHRRKEILYKLR